jgi:hypothetical protein
MSGGHWPEHGFSILPENSALCGSGFVWLTFCVWLNVLCVARDLGGSGLEWHGFCATQLLGGAQALCGAAFGWRSASALR